MCQFVINSGWQKLKNQMCYKIQFQKADAYTHLHIIWKGKDSLIINEFLRILKIMSQKKLLVAPSLWVHQKYHKEKLVYS